MGGFSKKRLYARLMKILFLSIPSFPYNPSKQSSVGERLFLATKYLREFGVHCDILAPEGSDPIEGVIMIQGEMHINLEKADGVQDFSMEEGFLENMLEYARKHQDAYDFIITVGQDYMTYLLQPYFKTPFLIIPNRCDSIPALDRLLVRRYKEKPHSIGFLSESQARYILRHENEQHNPTTILWEPFDIAQYDHNEAVNEHEIFWAGRIHPDKGVSDVVQACKSLGKKLVIAGEINEQEYFGTIMTDHNVRYAGILGRPEMGSLMAKSPVFFQLQSSRWQEAFGRTTAEALLAGCPVIGFKSGANAELIEQGVDGFIVSSVQEAIDVYPDAIKLDRSAIKARAQARFHAKRHAENIIRWLLRQPEK